jgi:phage shock protein A
LAAVLDQRSSLDSQVRVARQAISELEKDAKFAASLEVAEILCPTCGTVHQNDFANRFGILDDREACFEFLTRSHQEMRKLSEGVLKAQLDLRDADKAIAEIQGQLDEKLGAVSLRDVIEMQGRRAAAELFVDQLSELDKQIGEMSSRITEIEDKQETFKDKKRREKIESFYAQLMLRYLHRLDVAAIDHATVSKINGRISDTGSDQPRAVLAYDLALLKTIYEFKGSFTAPMVLDSPNQQDQDEANVAEMIKLIISERPENGQTILATVSMHGVEVEDGSVLEFDQKLTVLKGEEFDTMNNRMHPLFNQMQA